MDDFWYHHIRKRPNNMIVSNFQPEAWDDMESSNYVTLLCQPRSDEVRWTCQISDEELGLVYN